MRCPLAEDGFYWLWVMLSGVRVVDKTVSKQSLSDQILQMYGVFGKSWPETTDGKAEHEQRQGS